MSGILDGKVVIVSGVGPGLGREIASVAHREGARVMMGARREANLKEIAASLGDGAAWQATDICDEQQCIRLVEAAVERFGEVHGLVNCAAFDSVMGGLMEADLDEWRRVLDTNIIGTLQLCRAAIPVMTKAGGGSIVFIGSQTNWWPGPAQTAYAASKAGLVGAQLHLAREVGPMKIRVNTVVPTWMWGPPVQQYVGYAAQQQGVPEEDIVAGITKNMPLGEIPADEDIAEAVAFFLSERARMITGQSLFVNAGEFFH
jgi:NAD(P)-dependent dehydrogenase (short-subunit alcohol dehydrogenase family)